MIRIICVRPPSAVRAVLRGVRGILHRGKTKEKKAAGNGLFPAVFSFLFWY